MVVWTKNENVVGRIDFFNSRVVVIWRYCFDMWIFDVCWISTNLTLFFSVQILSPTVTSKFWKPMWSMNSFWSIFFSNASNSLNRWIFGASPCNFTLLTKLTSTCPRKNFACSTKSYNTFSFRRCKITHRRWTRSRTKTWIWCFFVTVLTFIHDVVYPSVPTRLKG